MTMLNSTCVGTSTADTASLVRSRPYTTHGCRPVSAATQPASLDRIGPITATTNTHSSQRVSNSFFRHSMNRPNSVSAMKLIPSAAIRW